MGWPPFSRSSSGCARSSGSSPSIRRGSGASELLTRPYHLDEHVKDVQAVLAALGRPVVGVGISAGANLLLKLAHADPRLFAKLVTVGAPPSDFSRAFHPSYLERHKSDLEKQDVSDVVRSHTELVFSEPEMRELREQTIRSRLQLPCETILSFFDPDPGKDVMPLLADIRLPVLVTHGRRTVSLRSPRPSKSRRGSRMRSFTPSRARATSRSSLQRTSSARC